MRSTTTLLLLAAAAASAHYTHHSIPEVCASAKRLVQVDEAVMLSLWAPTPTTAPSPDCQISLRARQGHLLSIAYVSFRNQTDDCPIKLDLLHNRDTFHASLADLCERQQLQNSSLSNMFLGDMTLVVNGEKWPPLGHGIVVTAIGLNSTCLDKQRYFPCVMMDTPLNSITSHLKYCVPQSVVCDGLLNCPASGADEIEELCRQQLANHSTLPTPVKNSKISEQLRRLSEKTHLVLYNNMADVPFDQHNRSHAWWWFGGAVGMLLVAVLVGLLAAKYNKKWSRPETDSQMGLSLSAVDTRPAQEEPPPDYKTIFPQVEEVV